MRKHPSRSRSLHSRSKARTQLSPLLENTCSPIARMDHRPPSSLLTASYTTPTTSTFLPPGGPSQEFLSMTPIIHISFPHQVPSVQFPFTCGPPTFPSRPPSHHRPHHSKLPPPTEPVLLLPDLRGLWVPTSRHGGEALLSPLSGRRQDRSRVSRHGLYNVFQQNRPEGKVSVTVYIVHVRVHVHIHNTCIHTHVHVHIHTHIHVYTHMYMYVTVESFHRGCGSLKPSIARSLRPPPKTPRYMYILYIYCM